MVELTDPERYGKVLHDAAPSAVADLLGYTWEHVRPEVKADYQRRAAAVVAAYRVDLAVQICLWKDETEREAADDLDSASGRCFVALMDLYDRLLTLLTGDDDGTD